MELRDATLLLCSGIQTRLLLRNAVGVCQDRRGHLSTIPRDLSNMILQYIPDLRVEYTEESLVAIEQNYIDFMRLCAPDSHDNRDTYISRSKVIRYYGVAVPLGECYLKLLGGRLYVGSSELLYVGQAGGIPNYAEYLDSIIRFISSQATHDNSHCKIGLRYVLPCGLVLADYETHRTLLIDPETGISIPVKRDPHMDKHHYDVDDYGNFTMLSPMVTHNIPDYATYATIGNAARLGSTRADFASFNVVP